MSLAIRVYHRKRNYAGIRCGACGDRLSVPHDEHYYEIEIHTEVLCLCEECVAMLADQLDAIRRTNKEGLSHE